MGLEAEGGTEEEEKKEEEKEEEKEGRDREEARVIYQSS